MSIHSEEIFSSTKIEQYTVSAQQLFLKAKNYELDLGEIPLLKIIENYLAAMIDIKPEYIKLDIVAEFLITVANLILFKTIYLLPNSQEQDDSIDEEEENILKEEYWKEYKKYQSLIKIFEEKETKQSNVYHTFIEYELEETENYQENHFSDLIIALESVLSRKKKENIIGIKKREYNITQKIKEIEDLFKKNNSQISFQKIINPESTRIEIIITFLALLELICRGKIDYFQSENFGDIIFYRKDDKKLANKI
ncbi:MAG: segregation/condensation protein A [Atribacterota bacterium]|nr:segregation/condensation protein A [Atribacterota bacterium]